MSGMFPIIRRVRRPLVPVTLPADAKPVVVPVQAKLEPARGSQGEQPTKDQNGKATASEPRK